MVKDVSLLTNNGVNVAKSLELFGDMTTYDATLEDFLSAINEKLTKIKSYKEVGDMANYAILVHSLKSDAKYFGFDVLATLAYNHEMESKANNSSYVFEHFDELIIEATRIVNLVKKYLAKPVAEVGTPIVETPTKIIDKALLIVDDSNIVANFIKKIFHDEFEVLIASDGREAINIIDTNPSNKIVAMLLDLNMPRVNGFDVLEHFTRANLFKQIPVSIITGEDSKETIERAFKYPVVDMLTKPFNERDVKRIVEKTILYSKM